MLPSHIFATWRWNRSLSRHAAISEPGCIQHAAIESNWESDQCNIKTDRGRRQGEDVALGDVVVGKSECLFVKRQCAASSLALSLKETQLNWQGRLLRPGIHQHPMREAAVLSRTPFCSPKRVLHFHPRFPAHETSCVRYFVGFQNY